MQRKSESAQDKRLLNIALTAKGRDVLAKIVTFALSFEKTLMAALEQQEADVLKSTFETLHRVLDSDPHAGLRSRLDVPAALPAKGPV